jgi:uncharacterized membrane protein
MRTTSSPEYSLLTRRQDALGSRGRLGVFASLCVVSFALAGLFAAMGAWLIWPYSVLEMVVVYAAFRYVDRRARDWERLTISGDEVIVECSEGRKLARHVFSRYWVSLALAPAGPGQQSRLVLSQSGQSVQFGAFMTADELAQVARDIRARLSGGAGAVAGQNKE